ncbi:MAG: ATP-binding cassette domain-containing protein [Ilumatobacter sp.]|uniref:ATP-binding cassette domain-containing protein n=1 Tax=Ilumatobacter sp. TaxID=1967498 RepID=UPI00262DE1BB|nr:ATP-binding cassette domain-containing protein [Ilumatobacter sp.]MDJ0771370.1 ATP-binding cassette domain-containing protein [Ilumatobacter sp.]
MHTTTLDTAAPRTDHSTGEAGSEIHLDGVGWRTSDGAQLVADVSAHIAPGELVGIVGASGAGKSTLLRLISGALTPTTGTVHVDGAPADRLDAGRRLELAVVPQDDHLPADLTVRSVLTYAARLRLPAGSSRSDVDEAVARGLRAVELEEVADRAVRQLSGGQRRRASIAAEMVAGPRACLLDEPTSGLDPVTAATVMSELDGISDDGRTVVITTHDAADLARCDRILALAPGGRLAFDGTLADAMAEAGTTDLDRVHRALTHGRLSLGSSGLQGRERPQAPTPAPWMTPRTRRPGRLRQWHALTSRSIENMRRNRLTLAILVGSPAMVIAMFAVLFNRGAFDASAPSPTTTVMIAFWVAFGGFFFGLTYGLLQLCSEITMISRERRAGVAVWLQVLAKVTALAPILVLIDLSMLIVLRWLGRLPATDTGTTATLAVTLILDSLAALTVGLLASAAVRSPAQAALALPMLCFPAVLFSGAILPVPAMAVAGRGISAAMSSRWAFEAIGNDLSLRSLFSNDPSPFGSALLDQYGDTWTTSTTTVWLVLAVFTAVTGVAAWATLAARSRDAR